MRFPFSILLFVFCFPLRGQERKIDSLKNILLVSAPDTGRVNTLNELSDKYWRTGNYDQSLRHAKRALLLADSLSWLKGKAKAHQNMGIVAGQQGNYPEAMKQQLAALETWEHLLSDPSGTSVTAIKAGIASAKNNIGTVCFSQGNYDEALNNYRAALRIKKELRDERGIAQGFQGIGVIYAMQRKYAEALASDLEGLRIFERIGDKRGMANSYTNIGNVYFADADFHLRNGMPADSANKAWTTALDYYHASLKLKEEMGDKRGIASSRICLGLTCIKLQDRNGARGHLSEGLSLARAIGSQEDIRQSYMGLAELDSSMGDFKGAYENYKMGITYRDSLINEENIKTTERAKNQYEFDKKEAISAAEREKEKQTQRVTLWLVIAGLVLVIVFSIFLGKRYRVTQLQKKIIEGQKRVVEEKNKDILDSIYYARRIQRSLLPTEMYIEKNLDRLIKR